ncbi:MAG: hypothetical protein ACREFP_11370 [Acetobacteraceae bacterium]
MPGVAGHLRAGGSLVILAIGSASAFGAGGRHPALGFPSRMLVALRRAVPGAETSLLIKDGRGLTAAEMLPVLRRSLRGGKIGLVIWQTGTVEAVENSPPEDFLAALADGVSIVLHAGAELILVEPAFSRFLSTDTNIDAYQRAFREAAIEPGVVLFPRFELTRYWVDEGSFDLEAAPASAVAALARARESCIGQALARFVLSGAGVAAPSPR